MPPRPVPRSGLWVESQINPEFVVESFAERQLVICRDQDLLSLVFARLKRHRAGAAIVFRGAGRPRVSDIAGIVTERVIADAVIDKLRGLIGAAVVAGRVASIEPDLITP